MAGRAGWALPGAALVTLVFTEVLRVWFPSVLFIVGDAGSTPAPLMGAFGLACLAVAPLLAGLRPHLPVKTTWLGGAVLLALGRLLLLFTDGGGTQVVVTTLAVIGATVALTALAAAPVGGQSVRLGVLFGVTAATGIHAALNTHDLVWRAGLGATIASIVIVLALLVATQAFASELDAGRTSPAPGAAWPWQVIGPLLLLVGVLGGVPGRVAIATGWPDLAVALTMAGAPALAVLAALIAPRVGPTVAGAGGAALVLVGTAGSLPAAGVVAVASQIVLMVGLGAIVGSTPLTTPDVDPRRRAVAASGAILAFGVLTFAYYAAYDVPLRINNRSILLLAAAWAACVGAAASWAGLSTTLRPMLDRRRLGRAAGALVVITALAGVGHVGAPVAAPAVGPPDQPIRVALYNVHMGFDTRGRFSVSDIAAVLRAHSPDVVVLNEVDRGWLTTGGHDVLRLLAAELGLDYHFARGADEVWGNGLLTRFPVEEFTSERLPRGNDAMVRSQFVAILATAQDQQLAVLGTHLSHVDDQGDTRLPQARAVAANVAVLRERGLPTVVMGDLNAGRDDPELATLASLLVNTVPEGVGTFPSWDPQAQIDHILISPDLMARDLAVPQTQASDHLPVVATVERVPSEPAD